LCSLFLFCTCALRWCAQGLRESLMSKLTLICTTLSSVALFMCSAWAGDRVPAAVPVPPNLAYPNGSEITFQWTYSCHDNQHCTFNCGLSANSVSALTIYLGVVPLGNNQKTPALFYFYSTPTIFRNNGFRILSGPYASLSCEVNGMILDYSGPPKEVPSPKD
jgi:hypothetical protein